MTRSVNTLITAGLLGLLIAFPTKAQAQYGAQADIVETAVEAGSFETLARALEAAGLVETLKGEGPFTVFAPTDEAFARLPEGTLESLLQNPDELARILTYHVVPGEVTSSQVVKLDRASTVQGQNVRIRVVDGSVMVNDATVVQADVRASNGVIHVIDRVILPSESTGQTGGPAR